VSSRGIKHKNLTKYNNKKHYGLRQCSLVEGDVSATKEYVRLNNILLTRDVASLQSSHLETI